MIVTKLKPPTNVPYKKSKYYRSPSRTRVVTKCNLPMPQQFEILPSDGGVNDVVNLTIFNMTAWVLPMAITGRVMGMEWKDLSVNLLGLGMFRSAIEMFHELHN